MRILLYVAIIGIGSLIGYKDYFSKDFMSKLDKIQHFCLLLLLFIMGVKIGINEEILKAFPRLGLNALIISSFSIIFSVIAVRIISKYVISTKKVDKI